MLLTLIRLLPKTDITEGSYWPDHWWAWGNVIPGAKSAPTLVYFFLKLPSFQWRVCGWKDSWSWHQLHLVYTGCEEGCRQFDSPWHGWRFDYVPAQKTFDA